MSIIYKIQKKRDSILHHFSVGVLYFTTSYVNTTSCNATESLMEVPIA